ncbi:hypothetical protein LC55x_1336 [Lysobacter capsici]|nr:hypothetical protein LC55x_1336 [Lysobacter capsici]
MAALQRSQMKACARGTDRVAYLSSGSFGEAGSGCFECLDWFPRHAMFPLPLAGEG